VTSGQIGPFSSLNPIFSFKAAPGQTLFLASSFPESLPFSLFNRQDCVGSSVKSVVIYQAHIACISFKIN